MNPIQRIEYHKDNYTKVETQIYQWIKKQPQSIIRLHIEAFAEETKTSKAAIIRFCKKIGYNGFAEFKFELSRYIISGERDSNSSDDLDTIKSITSLYEGYLRQFSNTISLSEIKKLVEDIKSAKRIKIIGNNRTGLAAMQMRLRMSKIGFDAEGVTDMTLVISLEDILSKGDVVILFSVYAKSKVYSSFVKEVKDAGAKIALVTMTPDNSLAKHCDYVFNLPCISKASTTSFLDDQALLFVFIEILLAELAY
ncbi:MAG: MurR/RpiR family transcriptional regulator [Coprobacillaceae bacterium]